MLIIVDDAHWADEPSLRWLAYLATRLDGLGAALLVALRPAEAASRAGPLRAVRSAAAAVRPAVLTGDGVAVLARAALGEGVPGDQCAALRAASGGNPFYLSELLRARSQPGEHGRRSGPGRRARLWSGMWRRGSGGWIQGALPWPRRWPSSATAAGCGMPPLSPGWICPPPSGWRPIWSGSRCWPPPTRRASCTRSCATRSRPHGSDERDTAHRRAARELDGDGAAPGQVAAHLMRVQPADDPWVVARLRQAARAAAQAGAPGPAGELLRRALAEPPPRADRLAVLGELAAADANAGRETALGWLEEALALTEDPRQRAAIAHEVARTYAALFRWVEAADVTSRALAELGGRDPELTARLEAELAVAGMHDARRARRVAPAIARLAPPRASAGVLAPGPGRGGGGGGGGGGLGGVWGGGGGGGWVWGGLFLGRGGAGRRLRRWLSLRVWPRCSPASPRIWLAGRSRPRWPPRRLLRLTGTPAPRSCGR